MVRSFDQDLAKPFNAASNNSGTTQGASAFNTYEVDEEGFIDFPVLGKIPLEGKTIKDRKSVV